VALGVLGLCRLWPIAGDRLGRNLALHLAPAWPSPRSTWRSPRGCSTPSGPGAERPVDFSEALSFSFRHNFHVNVVTYWAIVGVFHLVAYYRGLREKELVASRLEEQLARAELSALRMQLQPHFLFNALNSISELVYSDPAAADRMLVRLSDLLRRSLETTRQHEVPLEQELDFLQRYLEIERMRYPDRLQLQFFVDEFVLDGGGADLPAPAAGRERRGARGRPQPRALPVTVRGRREADELYLEVENDLPPGAATDRRGAPTGRGWGCRTPGPGWRSSTATGGVSSSSCARGNRTRPVVLPFRELDGARHVRSR